MRKKTIIPVVHATSIEHGMRNIDVALFAGAKKIALINQYFFDCVEFEQFIIKAITRYSDVRFVVNWLGVSLNNMANFLSKEGLKADIWEDRTNFRESFDIKTKTIGCVYGGYNFKYQKKDEFSFDEVRTWKLNSVGLFDFVLTLSGNKTGSPIKLDLLKLYNEQWRLNEENNKIAVASGITANNLETYLPFANDFFVGTSIEDTEYNINYKSLNELIKLADDWSI